MSPLEDPVAWAEAQAVDPVRHRMLVALARHAAAQPTGPTRDKLLAKLHHRAQGGPVVTQRAAIAPPANPFAELLSRLRADAGQELRHVQLHQGTWRQLRMARRAAELSAPVPIHLGPLNSQVLAARALQQLRSLAPDYLHRLLTQMDTIAALAAMHDNTDAERSERIASKKTPTRRK